MIDRGLQRLCLATHSQARRALLAGDPADAADAAAELASLISGSVSRRKGLPESWWHRLSSLDAAVGAACKRARGRRR